MSYSVKDVIKCMSETNLVLLLLSSAPCINCSASVQKPRCSRLHKQATNQDRKEFFHNHKIVQEARLSLG